MAEGRRHTGFIRKHHKKRPCVFCMTRKDPHYLDIEAIDGYVGDNKRILPRRVTGTCAKHQRGVTQAIKRARYLAFLAYVN